MNFYDRTPCEAIFYSWGSVFDNGFANTWTCPIGGMMAAAMLRVFILIAAGIPTSCLAQDFPTARDVGPPDLIVIGTLYHDFTFPWIDGWNERGHIDVERTLKGSALRTKLSFAWERDWRTGWCVTRPDWRGEVGKRGIWLLTRDGGRYRAPSLFSGFLHLKYLEEVNRLLSEGSAQRALR